MINVHQQKFAYPVLGLLAALVIGCSDGSVTVEGVLKSPDGSPLVGARVNAKEVDGPNWASGTTNSDGRFNLGRSKPGEGVPPGSYRITIAEDKGDWDNPSPRTISAKYSSAKASGIAFEAVAGERVTIDEQLDPP